MLSFAISAGEVVADRFGGDEQGLGDIAVTQGLGG
jgi:hypothetical protein